MPKIAETEKEARRTHILRAAVRCFARKGFHLTTIDDIAAEAGVSKGAPYVYFDSKVALFQSLYDSWDCALDGRIEAALAGLAPEERRSARHVLHAIIVAVGEQVTADSETCRVLLEARTQAAYLPDIAAKVRRSQARAQGGLEQVLQAGVVAHEWPPDTSAVLHARLILATLYGLMAEWHLQPGSFSWADVANVLAPVELATSGRAPAPDDRDPWLHGDQHDVGGLKS